MDFVQAKAILDKFASVYRAAEFMAEALETAASLERRAMELQNNVDHLGKQQAEAQQTLAALDTAGGEAQRRFAEQQVLERRHTQDEADRVLRRAEETRAAIEQGITMAQARLAEYTQRADTTIADLDRQIEEKTHAVERLEASVEALRAQARQVLN